VSQHRVTRLTSGLTLATMPMPHMASVSLGLWVGVGSRYEPAALNGASHFIEHMLFKGTRRRSAKRISEDIEGVGGSSNAFTSEESTCFYARARHDRFDELLDVLADMFLHSRFAPADIAKERNVIKEELAMYTDQPPYYVQELLNATQWPNQPMGRSITGSEATLDGLGRAQLLRFFHTHYLATNTLITAAGRIRHQDLVKACARLQHHFGSGSRPRFQPVIISQSGPRVSLCTRQVEQTQMALGVRTCSRHDERRFALRLLNILLGENTSSRLFQVLREDHGLTYSINSSLSFFDDTGDLVVSAGLDADQLPRTLRLMLHEMRRLIGQAPSRTELQRAKDYVVGQIDLSLENTENQMLWLGEQLLSYGKITSANEIKARLSAVKPSEIRAVARDFFRSEQLNLALVSRLKSANRLARLLEV
jgi:predicted Zn-dependent peptidase